MNKIFLIGHLGGDVEARTTKNGLKIAKFSLATNYVINQKKHVQWHSISAFDKTADIALRYLKKGDQVSVVGEIRTHDYTGKDGIARKHTEVLVRELYLLNNQSTNDVVEETPF